MTAMAARVWFPSLVLFIFAIVCLNLYARKYFSSESRAYLFRAEAVSIFQFAIALAARYIWRNTSTALGDGLGLGQPNANGGQGQGPAAPASKLYRNLTIIFLVLCLLAYPFSIILVGEEPYFITTLCFICLGSLIQLVIFVFLLNRIQDLAMYTIGIALKISVRRRNRISLTVAVIYLLIVVPFGVYFVTQPPIVKFEQISIDKLPEELDGFRIVHISDVHLGPTVGKSKFSMVVDMVNRQKPDAVVMVGDFVDSPVYKLVRAADPVKNLRAPKGIYFVSGNHEYHTADVDAWFDVWRSHGVTVLHNDYVNIHSDRNKDAQFCLSGTDDLDAGSLGYEGHGMDLDRAVRGCKTGFPIILLAHQPKAAKIAMDSDHEIQLVLSGHTHGGQFFPLHALIYLTNPFFAGLYKYGRGHVYVSQGTVYWGIPMRFGSQHEITVIILRTKQK